MRTQAALLTGQGSDFLVDDIDIEGPRAGEVLVQVEAAGICHTDLAARDGVLPIEFPGVIQGLIGAMAVRGTIGLIGVPSDPAAGVDLNIIAALTLGLTVKGIIEGDSVPDEFIPELVSLYREGRLPLDKLVTTFPFADINRAVAAQHDGEVVKPVLVFDDH